MNRILEYFKNLHSCHTALTGGLNLFNIISDYYINDDIIPSYPLFLSLSVTSMCNGHCLFCIANARKLCFEEDTTNPLLKERLIELANSTPPLIISLSGGEPLLFPNRCKEYLVVFRNVGTGTILSILSNLSFNLTPERLQVIEILEASPNSFIQTSIDSVHEEEHRILRRGTSLSTILNNVKYLRRRNIKIKINTTISEYNYKSIMDVVKYVFNEGIESLHILHKTYVRGK